jgi:hypothetical protein
MIASAKLRLAALTLIGTLASAAPAGAASYTVEGFTLGARAAANADFPSYSCAPSDRYAGATRCRRTQRRGPSSVSATVVNVRDGAVLYAAAQVTPVAQNRAAIEQEIASLTRQLGEPPVTLNWIPPQRGQPMAVIAVWGQVKLDPLPDQAQDLVSNGEDPRLGMLVDPLGDPTRSAKLNLTVYRALGGAGFVFSASFDAAGRGHRQYMALDGAQLAIRQFEFELRPVLDKDQKRPAGDLALWADVAKLTRRLALDTSAATADGALDRVYESFPSKKFRSHVWSLLPGGAIAHMAMHQYGTIDIYGPKTEHPRIRGDIQKFLADPTHAQEPFREFLFYVLGEPDQALAANPSSVLGDVFHYASGHGIMAALLEDATAAVKPKIPKDDPVSPVVDETVDGRLRYFNRHPELYDNKLLGSVIPNFAARADAAKPHFEFVLRTPTAIHADDAAYMLGWLAFHRDQPKVALTYLARAMEVGNAEIDYKRPAAMKEAVRVLERFPPREQAAIVGAERAFAQEPAMWYVAARSAYREFDYPLAVANAERALKVFNVPIDSVPPTTDPKRIHAAIEHANPALRGDLNLSEIPYLIEASKEFERYVAFLNNAPAARPDDLFKEARRIIIKYSLLLDLPQQPAARPRNLPALVHKDLRQALHLIDLTLAAVPASAPNAKLREWLYYRKARILAVYAPKTIGETIAAMQREYPSSQLMDDALAEELYAQGVMLRDVAAAEATFRKLIETFPRGNAVDNAHTWMAIIYRCEGREQDAQNMNREIIRRFPMTRHAAYARERMADPHKDACGL